MDCHTPNDPVLIDTFWNQAFSQRPPSKKPKNYQDITDSMGRAKDLVLSVKEQDQEWNHHASQDCDPEHAQFCQVQEGLRYQ